MTFMSRYLRLSALCSVLALGACTLLPPPSVHVAYQLPSSASPSAASHDPLPWTLRVATPQATLPLNSRQVIVRDANDSLASYPGIRWADSAPVLVRERLVQNLSDSGRFAAVTSDRSAVLANLELATDLRAFQLVRQAGDTFVQVRLDARLIDLGQRRILANHVFAQRIPVASTQDADAIIAAFGRAMDAISTDLTTWLASQRIPANLPARGNADAPQPERKP